jgi:hypothetical protein
LLVTSASGPRRGYWGKGRSCCRCCPNGGYSRRGHRGGGGRDGRRWRRRLWLRGRLVRCRRSDGRRRRHGRRRSCFRLDRLGPRPADDWPRLEDADGLRHGLPFEGNLSSFGPGVDGPNRLCRRRCFGCRGADGQRGQRSSPEHRYHSCLAESRTPGEDLANGRPNARWRGESIWERP